MRKCASTIRYYQKIRDIFFSHPHLKPTVFEHKYSNEKRMSNSLLAIEELYISSSFGCWELSQVIFLKLRELLAMLSKFTKWQLFSLEMVLGEILIEKSYQLVTEVFFLQLRKKELLAKLSKFTKWKLVLLKTTTKGNFQWN